MKFFALILSLLTFAFQAAAMQTVSFDALDWDVDGVVNWRWIGDSLHNLSGGSYVSSRTVETPQPFSAQVTLTPEQKLNAGSAQAGLALRSGDNQKNWHLAFADTGKRREVQLLLWSSRKSVKLARKFELGENFRWEYKKPYVLTLSLDHGKAVGTVADPQGNILCKVSADAGQEGDFPVRTAVHATTFRCSFKAPKASRAEYRKEEFRIPAQTFTAKHRYVSPRNVSREFSGKATGFFHIEQDPAGTDWVIDPAGKAMFLCGVDMLTYVGRHCEKLGYSPYQRNMDKIFGGDRGRWSDHTLKRLHDWGFNYMGTGEKVFNTKLPFSFNLMIGSSFAAFGDEYDLAPYLGRVGTAMPNPFHPRFGEWVKRRFLSQVGSEISNPYFVGYFCDNELQWLGTSHNPDGSGLFDDVMAKKPAHSARKALVKFLAERYRNDIGAFNREWKLNLKNFDEISSLKKLPHRTPAQRLVKQDFLSLVGDTYFSTIRQAIRELDSHHMFLGCRFAGMGYSHERVWKSVGKYCDIVTLNMYPMEDSYRNKFYAKDWSLMSALEWVHRLSRRPLMITEWAFLGLDSGLPCQYGAGQRFATQKERAAATEHFLRTTMSMPYMVGLNWYKHGDDPKLGVRRNFPEDSNYGLVNEKNEPYVELTDAFRRVQSDVDAARRTVPQERILPNGGTFYQKLTAPGDGTQKPEPRFRVSKNSISNGEIELRYEEKSPRIDYYSKGEKLGEITFLLRYQKVDGKDDWVYIDNISDIKVKRLADSAELSLAGTGKTGHGGSFRITARLLLPAASGEPLLAEILSARNTGKQPLEVRGVYFSPFPAFSPEIREVSLRGGLLQFNRQAAWYKPDDTYFAAASGFSRVHFHFYRSADGVLHPDCYHPLNRTLQPGEALKMEEPCYILLFSGTGDCHSRAKALLEQDIFGKQQERKIQK